MVFDSSWIQSSNFIYIQTIFLVLNLLQCLGCFGIVSNSIPSPPMSTSQWTLSSHKINPLAWSSLRNYFRKTFIFSLNQTTTHSIHYLFTSNTIRTIWIPKCIKNQKLFNIKFDKKFNNHNFIVEKILKFKTLSQLVCTNAYIGSVLHTIWKPKHLQF